MKLLYIIATLMIFFNNSKDYKSGFNDPRVAFEKNSLNIIDESRKNIIKNCNYIKDSIPDYSEKYYLTLYPSTCREELENDKYIGVKRCLVVYEVIKSQFENSKNIAIVIDPNNYSTPPSWVETCKKSGVLVALMGDDEE